MAEEPTPIPSIIQASSAATVLAAIAISTSPSSSGTTTSDETREPGLIDPRESITILHDAENFNVKHPLYSTWQLWFDSASKQDKAKSWDEALVKVVAFDSVEEFWGLYNNIVPPSLIHPNSNYYLFKQGIKPAWEDQANSKGGKWSVQLPRGKYSAEIDSYWLYTMLAAIGETFETPHDASSVSPPSADSTAPTTTSSPLPTSFSDEVTGVIVSARKAFYRINIWTRTASAPNRERIEMIGKHFKFGILGFDQGVKFSEKDKVSSDVEFVSHSDSQARYGTKVEKWTV